MITGNYNLTPTVEWKNVQFEDQFLECDTTLGDVNITLPAISSLNRFWSNRIHIINKVGSNQVNIIAFNNTPPFPPTPLIVNFINAVAQVVLVSAGDSCVITVQDENNWLSTASGGAVGVPIVATALAQVTLSTAPYVDLAIGSSVAVVNYNATAQGCTLVKINLANGNSNDWVVVATTSTLDTGTIGTNPI